MNAAEQAIIQQAAALDRADTLAPWRQKFALPRKAGGEPLLYFAGHSLGLAPLAALDLVSEELADWSRLAVLGHHTAHRPWIDYHTFATRGLQHLTGAKPCEVVAMNSLTVNLHLMMASFYRPSAERPKILIEAGAFSSDHLAVSSQLAWHGFDPATHLELVAPRPGEDTLRHEDIESTIERLGSSLALVLWPGVQFRTGQAFDCGRIAAAAKRVGATVGFDMGHAIGNLPLALHDWDADFAAWCSYKYLNAGPGAVGGCFVHERHVARRDLPRLAGWWGHEPATRFQMRADFVPSRDAAGWAISNPPVLATAPLIASLELFREADIAKLRDKSLRLTGFLLELLQRHTERGLRIVTPTHADERGCQVSMRVVGGSSRGRRVFDALGDKDVICDWREPDLIRVAPVPFYNSFADVQQFVARLATSLREVP
ncbi:MAG: kynureninase [Proteobacteria bacterium]|nr:kynureninase [Pseudomonadota bacterium]